MQPKYDISIVIPVYNNEKYIDKCLSSIFKQTFDINRIQVILINDGSVDNSLKVIKKYESDNIIVIDKKNSGVSDTRNIGMKHALGKYIMFLDSDDYISKHTCENIFKLFENNYDDIDLITYPIIYDKNGKYSKHPRYSKLYYKGTGIYDLNEDYNLLQATINVCIKNNFEDNILFDINQNFSEDERFNTKILMKKKKIGFCNEAVYYYRRHVGTANDTITNPFYSYEIIMKYYEHLFKKYEEDGHVPKDIQALFINNLSWRIKQDVLLPYHFEKDEYDKAVNRIKKLLKKVDVDVVVSLPYCNYYRMYILNLMEKNIDINIKNNSYTITSDNIVIEEDKSITAEIYHFKIRNNKIRLCGFLGTFMFEKEEPKLYLKTNNKTIKIDTFISNYSYYYTGIKTNQLYGFDIDIDLTDLKSFEMYIEINDSIIPITYNFNKFNYKKAYYKNKEVVCNDKIFKVKRKHKIGTFIKNSFVLKRPFPFILLYRFNYLLHIKTKQIWLYNDKEVMLDNAYIQFKHDFNKKDKIKRYFIYNGSLDKIKNKFTKEEQKYLVKYKSFKHRRLFLHSDKILTSFADLQVYCPFNNGIKWYRDIKNYDLIYLQHGILHANLIQMYSKEYSEIDKFIISTNFEKENLINKYHYRLEDLITAGMPRMLDVKKTKLKDKILFAPSWRKYLIGNLINNKRALKKKQFVASTFYKEIYEFLHSEELSKYLKDNKLILDFKLHPIFKEYGYLFELKDVENINLNFDKTDIYEYKLFITDFSSFQFDFVKLKRPIIYFMPDIKEFKAGLHTYRELDLQYEDAFGKLCLTSDELLKEMNKIHKNKYEVDKKYLNRMNKFFLDINNPTDNIYKELIK